MKSEGMTIREIAAALGMSKSSVDRMLKSVPVVPPVPSGTNGTSGTKPKREKEVIDDKTLF
jgi:hypothetical protein